MVHPAPPSNIFNRNMYRMICACTSIDKIQKCRKRIYVQQPYKGLPIKPANDKFPHMILTNYKPFVATNFPFSHELEKLLNVENDI